MARGCAGQIRRGDDAPVKIRIGYGFGTRTKLNDERFAEAVDALEELRFDSLWLSERLGGEAPDPIVGMAYRRRSDDQAEVRHQRAGAPWPQPRRAGQGAGDPRPPVGRTAAPGVRPRRRRPARAAGLRRRPPGAGRLVRRGAAAHPPPLARGCRRPRRPSVPLRGLAGAAQAGATAPRRVARRHRSFRAAPRRAARRRVAAVVHRARRGGDGAQGDRGGGGRARARASTRSTSAC